MSWTVTEKLKFHDEVSKVVLDNVWVKISFKLITYWFLTTKGQNPMTFHKLVAKPKDHL